MARRLAFSIPLLLLASPALGLELDWDTHAWPGPSTTSQTWTIGPGDVTVTVQDPGGALDAGSGPLGSPPSPVTSSFLDPTGNGGEANLFLKTDANTSSPWVAVLVDFTYPGGVTDLTFSILDVDEGFGYVDQLFVTGLTGGTPVDPASVTSPTGSPTWSFDGVNGITGTATAPQTGAGSADGTADLSFDAPVSQIRIEYRNTFFPFFAGTQWIGLADFQFTPEPGSGVLLYSGLLGLAWLRRRRRA